MIRFSKKDYALAKGIVLKIASELKKQHPKLIRVDSNLIHFMAYDVIEKCKLPISRGWFKWGKYVPVVDDVLVDLGMDKSQHQMYGNEVPMETMIECGCHPKVKR